MSNNQNENKQITSNNINEKNNIIDKESVKSIYEIPQSFSGQSSYNFEQTSYQPISQQQQNPSQNNLSYYSIPQESSQTSPFINQQVNPNIPNQAQPNTQAQIPSLGKIK